ncbi:hypothetical protein CYMTET_45612 [Cymbomonas tetramitiformis]|uniref:Paf1 complex subunit Cdc73 N-terminal domain-containing protein n=1 Tax=Cymbomonas tetramitiformis TaxID=36881 RepID=A0AAE0EYF5_9CHLO|nr:hypothetical protein CYMTET_45612 [Cymbomonas tetramitiformis]
MDPLRLLRDFITTKRIDQITTEGGMFNFGDQYSFPMDTETAYKSQKGRSSFYKLDALIYFYKGGQNLKTGQYLEETKKLKIKSVSYIDRKDLLAYLSGEIDTSESIQFTVPTLPSRVVLTRTAEEGGEERDAKRARVDDAAPMMATRLSASRERPLRDRNSVLRVPHKLLDETWVEWVRVDHEVLYVTWVEWVRGDLEVLYVMWVERVEKEAWGTLCDVG